ncbi:hypothetical protein MUY27_13580 [Mucilaginibacter sp. RS28]|uniref:Uncharacterized protein n=1 Tax=Mucilaginibacter straminoryzae TaxID=2932774 RepID=A0A9X1X4D1_9SPHI|nr:hypothetical protein [Mucilaginibacter straminoryzae]MCJ8210743.1 hypothetical protein [Mucilaginibacter straminoryzae]
MIAADIQSQVRQVVLGLEGAISTSAALDHRVTTAGADHQTTLREVIQSAFAQYGVEVEFSGKGPNERGVVIDIDEDLFTQTNADVNTLRFGQTVVRVLSL